MRKAKEKVILSNYNKKKREKPDVESEKKYKCGPCPEAL